MEEGGGGGGRVVILCMVEDNNVLCTSKNLYISCEVKKISSLFSSVTYQYAPGIDERL